MTGDSGYMSTSRDVSYSGPNQDDDIFSDVRLSGEFGAVLLDYDARNSYSYSPSASNYCYAELIYKFIGRLRNRFFFLLDEFKSNLSLRPSSDLLLLIFYPPTSSIDAPKGYIESY